MALTISVTNLKGGVGKTTTSLALAEAAASNGARVVLVDADPMQGALRWDVLARDSDGSRLLQSEVIGLPSPDLQRRLKTTITADSAQLVVIDCPPPGALSIAQSALKAADLVVMPCPPGMADLDRIRSTVAEIARLGLKVPARVVLTMTRPTADRDAARQALEAWGVPVFQTELPLRAAVSRAYGLPVAGILAAYGVSLLTEVIDMRDAHR